MDNMQSSREFPAWMSDVKYQEGAIVIKDGTLCSYWKYPKNGEMVWLPLDNPEQYDMLLAQDSLI